MKKSRFLWIVIFILSIAIIHSCSNDNSTQTTQSTVSIKDDFFDPASLTVNAGQTVVWRNEGLNTHTVTSGTPTVNPGVLFDSGALSSGSSFQFVFTTPGTYPYFCRIHGVAMTGTITVQ